MDEQRIEGGAGAALAAHSKDGAVSGPTEASNTMGIGDKHADANEGGVSGAAHRLSGQARDAAGRVASSVSEAASSAGQRLAGQSGRATEQAAQFVRDQPLAALLITGMVGLMLGVFLGRR